MPKVVFLSVMLTGFILGAITVGVGYEHYSDNYQPYATTLKRQCEENLPRNQFCEIIITAKPISESGG